jgi:hypothetical protein
VSEARAARDAEMARLAAEGLEARWLGAARVSD